MLPSGDDLDNLAGNTVGPTVKPFPLFLEGYSYNQQFVIGLERVAIMPDVIPSVGRDRISHNPELAGLLGWGVCTNHKCSNRIELSG